MHINELHIQNFRCFKEIKINFSPDNTAILIGINGSGKSAILDCIAALLFILYELMGVKERPNQVQEKINACFALIDEDKIEEAKTKLQELAELLGENDPEVVRGQTLISFLTE